MVLLQVNNLHMHFQTEDSFIKVLRGVTFSIKKQETLGIIGESGSGKSQIALSILKLFRKNQSIYKGDIIFQKEIISTFTEKQMRHIRGTKISMIFQDPMSSLNPSLKIKTQMTEIFQLHYQIPYLEALRKSIDMLKQVEILEPERIMESYPYQLSGGLCQRVFIAMALACQPELLIADEPTTAIDVLTQKEILHLIAKMQHKYKMSMLFITHDLGIVSSLVQNIIVLYKGMIIEKAPSSEIFKNPLHPYTKKLLNDFFMTSIYKKQYKKNTNLFEAQNDIFDFYMFKNYLEPDPDFLEVTKNHFISCTLKRHS
ncbi:ABC transporter ATP-binding protein [Candidatus Phytoplasma melaleucae]|uniref:ABC transporter ATP-binding protein n=1 Tax=Candidatus Phytoplasma melaleucae TaxID=2982630 RepID=A0ABT9DCV5_9MOLU|nr:ABC transporter ATP-binding protein ['Melaleuca sp.' phytoplasma]MDO8167927.1 ABC transporter ATP-binding protein ['Melaleuca sp.' phytoplasma]